MYYRWWDLIHLSIGCLYVGIGGCWGWVLCLISVSMVVAFLLSPYGTCYWLGCAWGSLYWYTPFCGGKIRRRIRENYDCVSWRTGRPFVNMGCKILTYEILLNLLVLPESLYVSICWRVLYIHKSTFLTGYHCLCSLCFVALFIHILFLWLCLPLV